MYYCTNLVQINIHSLKGLMATKETSKVASNYIAMYVSLTNQHYVAGMYVATYIVSDTLHICGT